MSRNGTPPWPGTDDLDHRSCEHDCLDAFSSTLTPGVLVETECADCGRTVSVGTYVTVTEVAG